MRKAVFSFLGVAVLTFSSLAQDTAHNVDMPGQNQSDMQNMPGMSRMGHEKMSMESRSLIELLQRHATAGTDAEPNSTPFDMLMTTKGNWTFMFHGEAFLADIQQSGPRGADKLFSTNWFMPMAQRKLGRGTLTIRTMLSFEPGTVPTTLP